MNLIKVLANKYKRINKNNITFMSFNGKYADSPKSLTEYIHKIDKNKNIIWLVNDVNNQEIPDYVHVEKYGTKEAWKYFYNSKIIVDNVYGLHESYLISNKWQAKIKFKIISFLKQKKGQFVYTTWHGTPLKKMGIDAVGSNIIDFCCPNTTMVLDNKYTYNIMKRLTFNKIDMKLIGAPKNDILFDQKIDINKLKQKLGLPKNRKIILFAPSFRSDNDNEKNIYRSGINQINMMDIDKLLEELNLKFGGEWSVVCRFHYHVENNIDWNELEQKYGQKIINGNKHQDIMEYLKCSDILMTDISSCLFDFALTKKPIFLFFPDLENYKNNERGLYIEVSELPFKCSTRFKQLLQDISQFSEQKYNIDLNKFIEKLGYVKEENASEKVAKFILEDSDKK